MEPKEFGAFIQVRRKELGMTQNDLAEKLNVTAKAVSRWERGVGFPDIQLLQPLADGLDITLIELMQSRRMTGDIPVAEADAVVSDVMDALQTQQKDSRKTRLLLFAGNTILFAVYLFLGYVTKTYLAHSPWLYVPMVLIYVGIWHYGIPVWKAIVTGTSVTTDLFRPVPLTWKTGFALTGFLGGLAIVFFSTLKLDEQKQLHDFLTVAGLMLCLFAGIYYYDQIKDQ